MLCGTPSGKSTFDVEVSPDPARWFYRAEQKTRVHQGPKTLREILNPDCDAVFKNRVHLTDLFVSGCISPHWAEDSFENKPWEEAIAHNKEERLIALGAEPITPVEPADRAWKIICLLHLGTTKIEYTSIQVIRYCAALGSHIILSESPGSNPLIDHIRKTSLSRLHGPRVAASSPWYDCMPNQSPHQIP